VSVEATHPPLLAAVVFKRAVRGAVEALGADSGKRLTDLDKRRQSLLNALLESGELRNLGSVQCDIRAAK